MANVAIHALIAGSASLSRGLLRRGIVRAQNPRWPARRCIWWRFSLTGTLFSVVTIAACSTPTPLFLDEDQDGILSNQDCDDNDPNVGTAAAYRDQDQDGYYQGMEDTILTCNPPAGYALRSGDCDDSNPAAYPGALEVCDEADDQNCDGIPDSGENAVKKWYPDRDGDGYGDAEGDPVNTCPQPVGFSLRVGDCDDTRDTVYPEASEVLCNGVDENCNGPDDDHPDSDGDGFDVCMPGQPGEDGQEKDCNDGDGQIHPGALELCFDGDDSDCSGSDLPCQLSLAAVPSSSRVLALSAMGHERLGTAIGMAPVAAGSVGPSALILGAPSADSGSGRAYLVYPPTDLAWQGLRNIDLQTSDVLLYGPSHGAAGTAVAIQDVDVDGDLDFLVGIPGDANAAKWPGLVYTLFGPWHSGEATTARDCTEVVGADLLCLEGESADDQFGVALDFQRGSEGHAGTLAVGASFAQEASKADNRVGTVSFFQLQASPSQQWSRSGIVFGAVDSDSFGHAVASSNARGIESWLVGADEFSSDTSQLAGAAFLFFLDGSGEYAQKSSLVGGADGQMAGVAVAIGPGAGPQAADAYLIGSPSYSAATPYGAVYLFYDPIGERTALSQADVILRGEAADDAFGASVAFVDIDGDGPDDILVGAPGYNGGAGGVFVFVGPKDASQETPLELTLTQAEVRIFGQPGDGLGSAVAFGDFDGDGISDLVMGASSAGSDAGSVYVLCGAMDVPPSAGRRSTERR